MITVNGKETDAGANVNVYKIMDVKLIMTINNQSILLMYGQMEQQVG